MMDYKDFIKKEINENGVLEHWIEQPFFKPSDFKEKIDLWYNQRFRFVARNEPSIESEIEFIKEELEELRRHIKQKPSYDYARLSFTQRISGDCWFSDETIDEFERYFIAYRSFKYLSFRIVFLGSKLKELSEPKPVEAEELKENPHPLVFVNLDVYDRFIEYANKIDPKDYFKSYSYLKKRLEAENLIHKQTDTDFMYFVYDELNLITKEQHQQYLTIGQLESTKRTKGKGRENGFNNTFGSLCLK